MTLPNFLILGAPKCGTTSLYSYLGQHPDVFMGFPKEPTFFGHEGEEGLFNGPGDNSGIYRTRMITKLDAYTAIFNRVTTEKAIGEASTFYLYLPKAPLGIKKYIPHANLFAVLRNPADRAYSNYLHMVRQLREPCTFEDALRQEPDRIKDNWNEFWHYKSLGLYSEQVKRYYDIFGRNQIHIFLHEDLQRDMLGVLRRVFEILGVDASFVPDMSTKWNVGYMPKNAAREKFYYKLKGVSRFCDRHLPWRLRGPAQRALELVGCWQRPQRVPRPAMPTEQREWLLEEYREDILKLEELLNRDLSHWLNPVPAQVAADD